MSDSLLLLNIAMLMYGRDCASGSSNVVKHRNIIFFPFFCDIIRRLAVCVKLT